MKNNLESKIQNKLMLWEIISQFPFAQDFPVGLAVKGFIVQLFYKW